MIIKVTSDIYDLSIDVTKWSNTKILKMLKYFHKRQIDRVGNGEIKQENIVVDKIAKGTRFNYKLKIEIIHE